MWFAIASVLNALVLCLCKTDESMHPADPSTTRPLSRRLAPRSTQSGRALGPDPGRAVLAG